MTKNGTCEASGSNSGCRITGKLCDFYKNAGTVKRGVIILLGVLIAYNLLIDPCWSSVKTVYVKQCRVVDKKEECTRPAKLQFLALEKQQLVLTKRKTQLGRLRGCKVWDKNNWSCADAATRRITLMADGDFKGEVLPNGAPANGQRFEAVYGFQYYAREIGCMLSSSESRCGYQYQAVK